MSVTLSILIPTFRRPEMLRQCLDGLVPQLADGRAEILVVDNDPAESARATVGALAHPAVRYVPEPRRGVVHARNRAIAEARGAFVAFIDDDEIPAADWVRAWLDFADADADVAAAFGKVVPLYHEPPAAGLAELLDDLYTRDLGRPAGSDVTDLWAHVGTGNSLFRRDALPSATPFDESYNASGGEDVRLAQTMIARGHRLRWNPDAVVHEQITPERSTLAYLSARKFRHGQQRIGFVRLKGGVPLMAVWIGIGVAQIAIYSARAAVQYAVGSPKHYSSRVRIHAGLGKLFWWRTAGQTHYAS
jgi:succinoglycan biosynthesis protein ExoM